MKKLPFLNSPRRRTRKISSAEYGSPLSLPDREQEILDLVNREAEIMYPCTNKIPARVKSSVKLHVHWSIFFKTCVYQFRP
jgi:hypothetical protein